MKPTILLALLLSSCAPTPDSPAVNQTIIDSAETTFFIAGAMRMDPATLQWYFIEDASHEPMGLSHVVTQPNGTAEVYFSETARSVGSFIVAPDETMTHLGLIAGASVGLEMARVEFNKPASDLAVPGGNVWIIGIMHR